MNRLRVGTALLVARSPRLGGVKTDAIPRKLDQERRQMQREVRLIDRVQIDVLALGARREKEHPASGILLDINEENKDHNTDSDHSNSTILLPKKTLPLKSIPEENSSSESSTISPQFSTSSSKYHGVSTTKSLTDYFELCRELNGGEPLLYYSDIRHQVTLLVHHFTNQIVVELNLRRQLLANDPVQNLPSSFLFNDDIILSIKNDETRLEILQILKSLLASPTTSPDLKQVLDQELLQILFNHGLLESRTFRDMEFWRYAYVTAMSGLYVTYDHSDTILNSTCTNLVDFHSPIVDDSEVITKLKVAFDNYEDSKQHTSLAHINLAANIVHIFTTTRNYTPSTDCFRYLMDQFGRYRLKNYESIVYGVLPRYEHIQTLMASTEIPDHHPTMTKDHFAAIIAHNPNLFETLLRYHVQRRDEAEFRELMKLFRLAETHVHELALKKTKLAGLISKSRFTTSHRIQFLALETETQADFETENPLLVNIDCLYMAIEGCIELRMFEYIDLLLTKLLLFNVQRPGDPQRHLALSVGLQKNMEASQIEFLISQNYTTMEISQILMTKEMVLLLLRACIEGKDMGRLLWLIPFLDQYIENNIEAGRAHIERIKRFNMDHQKASASEISSFEAQEKLAPFDSVFIERVYDVLKENGIDGKIHRYDKIFDFASTRGGSTKL